MNDNFSFDVLPDGSLILSVDGVCLRTAASRAYLEIRQAIEDDRLPAHISDGFVDVLAKLLNSTDFSKLRTENDELAGGVSCTVRICRHQDGEVKWEIV